MSSLRPRRLLLVPLLPIAVAGCLNINTKGYPLVERSDVVPLVTPSGDTTWAITRPPLTVVGRSRTGIDVPGGLTGVARGWERLFGTSPGAATVVFVEVQDRDGKAPPPIVLPDSLAKRTVVWVPTARWNGGELRDGGPMGDGARGMVMMGGPGGGGAGAALQLAQAWLDARLAREIDQGAAVPAWFRAGLVETLGGSDAVVRQGGKGSDVPRLSLDTLLARQCPAGWSPVTRWRPRPSVNLDSAAAAERRAKRQDDIRNDQSDRDRPRDAEQRMQAPCGPVLRIAGGSFLRYLVDRGGDGMADRLMRTYLQGGTLEQAVAGAPGLPQTRPELERAWRGWEVEQMDEMRRAGGR